MLLLFDHISSHIYAYYFFLALNGFGGMEAYWCHAVQNRHTLTLPEKMQLLWETYQVFQNTHQLICNTY